MNWPFWYSVTMNGPDPTMPSGPGSFVKLFTSFSEMSFQMCSGRMYTNRCSMIGVGFFTVMTTVVSSGAVDRRDARRCRC